MAPSGSTDKPGARGTRRRALIVAGPTCSGKSALAMDLAQRWVGTVINADSMQVYRELPIVTARPTPADEAAVPHRLYGIRSAAEPGSVAWWRGEALAAMEVATLPILCGGTGMYLRSLISGLADIPDPGETARAEARTLLATEGAAALHARLRAVDPGTATTLRPADGPRIARAGEVWRGTGRGLAEWQQTATTPGEWDFAAILLDPPRTDLRAAIATRFDAMLHDGALAEVQALLDQQLDQAVPAMQAHGVPELAAYLRGETLLAEAVRRAVLATGQYTKRQATWFRHQPLAEPDLTWKFDARYVNFTQFSERWVAGMQQFVNVSG
jgi:tRNA dimethylallyltransferase